MEREVIPMTFMLYISNESVIVGHLPRKILPITSLFLMKDGTIVLSLGKKTPALSAGVHVSRMFRIFSVI